ncbi:MAG: alpha/beta hydrolase [Pseudomonadota bacterium]
MTNSDDAETPSSVSPPDPLGYVDALMGELDAGFPDLNTMDPAVMRDIVASNVQPAENSDDVERTEDRQIGPGLRVRIYFPHGERASRPAVVFMHGGGFVFCSIESHDALCRRMAKCVNAIVISVDYRLAPENPFPAAPEDAFAAYQWATENAGALGVDRSRICVAGDSAGGTLAAVICLMARDRNAPLPCAQVLLYPVIEPNFDTEGYKRFGKGCFNATENMRWYWRQYLQSEPAPETQHYAIPLRAPSLEKLPPAILVIPGRDPTSTEGLAYGAALRSAGNKVRVRTYPDLFHGFLSMLGFPPTDAALNLLWGDMRRVLSTENTANE